MINISNYVTMMLESYSHTESERDHILKTLPRLPESNHTMKMYSRVREYRNDMQYLLICNKCDLKLAFATSNLKKWINLNFVSIVSHHNMYYIPASCEESIMSEALE